jgi:hypothetical protein
MVVSGKVLLDAHPKYQRCGGAGAKEACPRVHSSGLVDGFRKALEAPVDVLVAQWIAHQTSDLGVEGSSPS